MIEQLMKSYFNRLDAFLEENVLGKKDRSKENPYHVKEKLKTLMMNQKWEIVGSALKDEIDDKFYYIERRTKFFTHEARLLNDLIQV